MRTVVASVAATVAVILLAGLAFLYSGVYHVGATDRHWDLTHWLLNTARMRSIKAHAAGTPVPAGLDDEAKIVMGTEHFAAHCAVCHGAPGVPKGDIAAGLYPQPPNLANAAVQFSPAELFWILKNGIKMSGMPSWADHSDDELWATVAFLEKLPGMSEAEYAKLVMASMAHGGHHQPGGAEGDHRGPSPAPGQLAPPGSTEHQR
jgi:mono/diheme cytochrome c family protein